MTPDPRAALARLVAALEGHLDAAANRRGEADPAVEAAYQRLADAFEAYDSALYETYDEVTPLVLYDDVEDEREDRAGGLDDLDDDLDDLEEDEEDEEDAAADDLADLDDDPGGPAADDDGPHRGAPRAVLDAAHAERGGA